MGIINTENALMKFVRNLWKRDGLTLWRENSWRTRREELSWMTSSSRPITQLLKKWPLRWAGWWLQDRQVGSRWSQVRWGQGTTGRPLLPAQTSALQQTQSVKEIKSRVLVYKRGLTKRLFAGFHTHQKWMWECTDCPRLCWCQHFFTTY